MKTKRCEVCRKRKPVGEFYRFHKGAWPRQARCKTCDNAAIVCLTCGAEVIWTKDDENRVTALYRRPGELWSKEHPACHEQTGLFG